MATEQKFFKNQTFWRASNQKVVIFYLFLMYFLKNWRKIMPLSKVISA